jgi:nicotinate-nucleotide adenylyltransferase
VTALAVFGGSFDPVHLAHLVVADRVGEALRLERVLFVPAHRQPLKAGGPRAPAEDRLEMLQLATAQHPGFGVSGLELERGGTSFTVDTLREVRALHPGAELWLILGADTFVQAGRWRRFEEVRDLARLVVVDRPGGPAPGADGDVRRVAVPALAISASDIRRRVAAGLSIRYLVPEPVRAHIHERGLYR